jgi:protein-tyrosine-phosphatase
MAESLLRAVDRAGTLQVASAGTLPGADFGDVAEVLAERGVSFTPAHRALDMSMAPDLLIVVCEEGCAACPYLPRAAHIVRWPLEDPGTLHGEARLEALRAIADRLDELSVGLLKRGASAARCGDLDEDLFERLAADGRDGSPL